MLQLPQNHSQEQGHYYAWIEAKDFFGRTESAGSGTPCNRGRSVAGASNLAGRTSPWVETSVRLRCSGCSPSAAVAAGCQAAHTDHCNLCSAGQALRPV